MRSEHGRKLRSELAEATAAGLEWLKSCDVTGLAQGPTGFYLEFIASKFDPAFFESKKYGIEVVSAKPLEDDSSKMRVTVFIPSAAKRYFQDRLDDYLDESKDKKRGPKNADTFARIDEVRFDSPLRLLWTDPTQLFPSAGTLVWWEVWVREELDHHFTYVARTCGVTVKKERQKFPDRFVHLVHATPEQIDRIAHFTGAIAELRRAKDVPSAVLRASNTVQADVMQRILDRTSPPPAESPAVCILDSGVNIGHPLLELASSDQETWAYLDVWKTNDGAIHGHGTQMAGLSLYGDLTPLLTSDDPIMLTHRIESYKVMPDDNIEPPETESYGLVYAQAIREPESHFPNRNRIYCSATTNDMESDGGTPTSWSGAIDDACADRERRRLFIISGGNTDGHSVIYVANYPAENESAGILDPAQAWNAVTVGAFTEMQTITDQRYANHQPLAKFGGLCPQSRTSMTWEKQWPIKPDIVLEGGNFAYEPDGEIATNIDDLSVLSTSSDLQTAAFSTFGFTSGAAALASHMGAAIAAQYPDLWPETIRALLIHSAEYTPEMLGFYDPHDELRRRQFVARFGHGVPNLERALWSLQNDLTLVVEGKIQPFVHDGSEPKNNEIIYYELPWPTDVLQANPEATVHLRVTLSYFVEPNPARRGFTGRYRYSSHGLRFAVRRPSELKSDFNLRVNALNRDEAYRPPSETDDGWFLKHNIRSRGSLVSDSWEGTAAELADRATIAIYPVGGWWKTLNRKARAERSTRFSLCVSLMIEDTAIDLYTPIQIAIAPELETR